MSSLTSRSLKSNSGEPISPHIWERVLHAQALNRSAVAEAVTSVKQCGVCGAAQQRSTPPVRWPLYRSAAYLNGPGMHWFSNAERIFHKRANSPYAWCVGISNVPGGDCDIVTSTPAQVFAKESFNWVYVQLSAAVAQPGHPVPSVSTIAKQAHKVLAPDGHLVVCAKHNQIEEMLVALAGVGGWKLKDRHYPKIGEEEQIILKKLHAGRSIQGMPKAPAKRACVWRSGALGDLVMITPLLDRLKADGYHVTVCTSRNCMDLLNEHPSCDNILMHEREVIHNPELGAYWDYWHDQYDKYINLSESVEGDLLRLEGRREFYDSTAKRSAECGSVNYFVHTMRKGGYEPGPDERVLPTLFFTEAEHKRAQRIVQAAKGPQGLPLVLWLLKGSSYHKTYPMAVATCDMLLDAGLPMRIALSAAPGEEGMLFAHKSGNVLDWVGKFSPRTMMLLTQYADLVVGPETGMMNAAACGDVPKIVLLSHSGVQNLCKYWTNTIALMPDRNVAPCYGNDGCHQLHYSLPSCPLLEAYNPTTGKVFAKAPACTMGIPPDRLADVIAQTLSKYGKLQLPAQPAAMV